MVKTPNSLINESSPYLLQHAYNPVNWVAWSEACFEQAQQENKLVLVSIGYSACHWCHVMEHVCFEDEECAQYMNDHFICIKVDREERPDVDHLYMTAVQLITQRGGWPLNCFTLPDGRPIYGGTYFPKDQWLHVLKSLVHNFEHKKQETLDYAQKLHEGIIQTDSFVEHVHADNIAFDSEKLNELILRWSHNFDSNYGGDSKAPKFPLPNNLNFLLYYGTKNEHRKTLEHVERTLDKMALGGIYDQIEGGFSRYAVDMLWKIPHFEKMTYDNGQLLSVYAQGYLTFKKPLYKRVIEQTVKWLEDNLANEYGCFFSALDADSEGEEGKYYCWTKSEIENEFGTDHWITDFYNINQYGYWEEDKYVLIRSESDESFCKKMGWTESQFEEEVAAVNLRLLSLRNQRIKPGLDDKAIASWNALLCSGFIACYRALSDSSYLDQAKRILLWFEKYMMDDQGKLYRTFKNGIATIDAFIEDYACLVQAYIQMYEATLDEEQLNKATLLVEYCQANFKANDAGLYFYDDHHSRLIARKIDLHDNVIPSGNSIMATNLFLLSQLTTSRNYLEQAKSMLAQVYEGMAYYGSGYSQWGILLMHLTHEFYTVKIHPENFSNHEAILHTYLPNTLLCAQADSFEDFQVCYDGTCLLPTQTIDTVLKHIRL